MIEKKSSEPLINIWFGNFYRPAYDDREFIRESITKLKDIGFNAIQLDSKAWEDFRDRFNGNDASQYVAQQEYMMEVCTELGISYNFLALYLCADNLYPNIRFSPPIFGESVTNADGSDGRWYKYWSEKAKDSMTEHTKGLFDTYGAGVTIASANGKEVMPTCTMWDPIIAPSFDEEGRQRYTAWLKKNYKDIGSYNKVYGKNFTDFNELQKEDYWFSCAYPDTPLYTKQELDAGDVKAVMWIDNMKWRIYELCEYFKDMQERIHNIDSRIYTMPDMAQWSYFLNIDASELANVGLADLWDTANRGIDIFKLSDYVDCVNFITVPITPKGDPDAYIVCAQHSMMRSMNRGREFMGGIYYGRFLYNDIYEFLTPCEIVGTIAASGAAGYTAYGMCGLDDGGVMHKMDSGFTSSLKTANEWLKTVIPRLGARRQSHVAVLFPSAMAAYEPMGVEGNKDRRYDFLGWYKMCCDSGFDCDIIDTGMINKGVLDDYKALIIPENDCFSFDDNSEAEKHIKSWTEKGGIVIHSPMDAIAKNCFGIIGVPHAAEPFAYTEKGLPQSDVFCSYDGEHIAEYVSDGTGAVSRTTFGKGCVYSFGFAYGFSYSSKIAPHVPLSERNNELYPVPLMKDNILSDILRREGVPANKFFGKNIETAEFDNCTIIVNHTSNPIYINADENTLFQYNTGSNLLLPRSAAAVFK